MANIKKWLVEEYEWFEDWQPASGLFYGILFVLWSIPIAVIITTIIIYCLPKS